MSIRNILYTGLWDYPSTLIKQTAAGIGFGLVGYFLADEARRVCRLDGNSLKNYFCLRSGSFFEMKNLNNYFGFIADLSEWSGNNILRILPERIFPAYPIVASNFNKLRELFLEGLNNDKLNVKLKEFLDSPSYSICLRKHIFTNEVMANVFAEELLFRYVLQKTLLLSLAKFLPERFGKILSNPNSRILIASFIFAFVHFNKDYLLPTFITGFVFGYTFEKYGIVGSSVAHFIHNFIVYNGTKVYCGYMNNEIFKGVATLE